MADRDELRALAGGTPPAPARVVRLDFAGEEHALEAPAAALSEACDSGCRVTLRLCGFTAGSCAGEMLAALAGRLEREGRQLAPDALALSAAVSRPDELALDALGNCRGAPPVYLLLPHGALEAIQLRHTVRFPAGGEAAAGRWWQALLALAAAAPAVSLVPRAPGPGVSPMAPAQRWQGPSPGIGELIPAGPCRLRLALDFGDLLAASGDDPGTLARLAERIVTLADELLDQLLGPSGPRRLALELDGIARAVIARGRDPRDFAALGWVKQRLGAFRDGARAASVRLARLRGGCGLQPFPLPGALEVADADALDRALLVHGARHTHLVCLSPWSLAPPEHGRACFGLLPALQMADSIAWRRPVSEFAVDWYSAALRFAWAVAMRS
jgi:hypothetical protein